MTKATIVDADENQRIARVAEIAKRANLDLDAHLLVELIDSGNAERNNP